jgi:hypothetical protein
MGRWCGGFIRGDGHRTETFQGFFPGEVTPQSAGRKIVRL